jgi:hypothetical protein
LRGKRLPDYFNSINVITQIIRFYYAGHRNLCNLFNLLIKIK